MTNIEDNKFLVHLSALISSRLLTREQYIKWSDSMLRELDDPPIWVMDLSLSKVPDQASMLILKAAYDNFNQSYEGTGYDDFELCASYLSYENGSITW
jgi:hypothetical protein